MKFPTVTELDAWANEAERAMALCPTEAGRARLQGQADAHRRQAAELRTAPKRMAA